MSDKELQRQTKAFVKKATAIVNRLKQARNELRELVLIYNDILEQTDQGLEDIDHGIDTISGLI